MALPESTNILIVGTGPAGLACAISLAVNGYKDITIVDARPSGRTLSRAIVIHAQTLEVRSLASALPWPNQLLAGIGHRGRRRNAECARSPCEVHDRTGTEHPPCQGQLYQLGISDTLPVGTANLAGGDRGNPGLSLKAVCVVSYPFPLIGPSVAMSHYVVIY